MNPNTEQWFSIIRWLLSVGGPVSSLLIARGMPADKVSAFTTGLLTLLGALPPVVSFIWGLFAHTDKSKVQAAATIPGTVVVTTPALAAATPLQANIVSNVDAVVQSAASQAAGRKK